ACDEVVTTTPGCVCGSQGERTQAATWRCSSDVRTVSRQARAPARRGRTALHERDDRDVASRGSAARADLCGPGLRGGAAPEPPGAGPRAARRGAARIAGGDRQRGARAPTARGVPGAELG